ncbi:MAG: EamA family transporter [Candidatus Micrarchaeota archaeon]
MLFNPYELLPPLGWVVVAIISISAWNLAVRGLMKKEKDFVATGASSNIVTALLLIPAILFLGFDFGSKAQPTLGNIPLFGWGVALLSSILMSVFVYLTYKASRQVDAAERHIISRTKLILVFLFASVFLSEEITFYKIIAAILIIAGSIVCLYRPGKTNWKINEGVLLVLIASALVAGADTATKIALQYFSPIIFAIPIHVIPALSLIFLMGQDATARIGKIFKKYPREISLIGAISMVLFISVLLSFISMDLSVAIPLLSLSVVLTAISGAILLNEKEGWIQKIIGALLAVAGASLIA